MIRLKLADDQRQSLLLEENCLESAGLVTDAFPSLREDSLVSADDNGNDEDENGEIVAEAARPNINSTTTSDGK